MLLEFTSTMYTTASDLDVKNMYLSSPLSASCAGLTKYAEVPVASSCLEPPPILPR